MPEPATLTESDDVETAIDAADELQPVPTAAAIVFGGSPFVRWTIGPVAALAAVGMATNLAGATSTQAVWRLATVVMLGALAVGVMVPRLGALPGRLVAFGVFAASSVYAVDMFSTPNVPTSGARSEPSRVNAILAMLAFGLPSLLFALRRGGSRPAAGDCR